MKIKYKFLLSILSIILIFGIILNIAIRYILIWQMETTITNSLNHIMYSSREAIKYRLDSNEIRLGEDNLDSQGDYLSRYISANFQCTVEMRSLEGRIITDNTDVFFKETLDKGNGSAEDGAAVINLKYKDKELYGILSYPIFINKEKLGILNVVKDFSDDYKESNKMIFFITLIEGFICIFIYLYTYILTTKITKPIVTLTEAVKEVGEGDYSFSVAVNGKDELSILLKEFIGMKDKIKAQIETIKEEKEKVETILKGRKSFFDNVTHEMKTPLTAISGYAEMIMEEVVKDEEFNKRAVERIYLESERLHGLIIDLIKVSKGLSYTKEEVMPIDMKVLIDETCDDMRSKARKNSLSIINIVESGHIFGQVNRIRELVINIIDNGVKYSRNNGEVRVIGKIQDNDYVFIVESMSGYIPEEVYGNIFEPFIKSSKFNEEESRGLGLYICNEIIKDHDGFINITNGEKVIVETRILLYENEDGNNLETI